MLTIDNIPLTIRVSKTKKVSLNLNSYRNLHYQVNNNTKRALLLAIKGSALITGHITTTPVELTYTIYRKTKKRTDLMNIGSVIDKFVSDALVTLGYLTDDNTDIIKKVTVIDGGIDKQNPRAKLEIMEM